MIFRFRIISDEIETFARSIEIQEGSTFLELHDAIQCAVNYDKGQLASFYISDSEWSRNQQITLLDMSGEDNECIMMNEAKINELISSVDDKIIYVFDFFANRAFYITLTEIKEATQGVSYPFLANAIGKAPEQTTYNNDSFLEDVNTSTLDDDFDENIGDEGFENIDDYYNQF